MNVRNKEIEHILDVFRDYLDETPSIDIQLTKYEYLLIMPMDRMGKEFDVCKLENVEIVCAQLLECIAIDYMYKLKIASDCIPKEYVVEFYDEVKKYMEKIPEYNYLLDRYICKWK